MAVARTLALKLLRNFLGAAFLIGTGAFIAACTEAVPRVTALSESKLLPDLTPTPTVTPTPGSAVQKHFILSSDGATSLTLFDVDTVAATSSTLGNFTLSHNVSDFRFSHDQRRVFMADGFSKLYVYDVLQTAGSIDLRLLSSATVTGNPAGERVCVSPDGSAVQVLDLEGTMIHSYAVSAAGNATYVNSVSGPAYLVACSSTNAFLHAVGYSGDYVETYAIHPNTKALTSVSTLSMKVAGATYGSSYMDLSADQQILFVAGQNKNMVSAYSLNATTGALTKIASVVACTMPNYLLNYAAGTRLLVNCQNSGQVILSFDRATNQFGSPLVLSTTSTGFYHISEATRMVYQYRSTFVDLKKINEDGSLRPVSQTLSTGRMIRSIDLTY